jgi:hypothetical protein
MSKSTCTTSLLAVDILIYFVSVKNLEKLQLSPDTSFWLHYCSESRN